MEPILGMIVILMGVVVFFIILYFISALMKAHKLLVKEPTQNGFITHIYSMIERKDKKTGIITWESMNRKIRIPEPPSESTNIMKKGRKYSQVYRLSEDEYIFAKDDGVDIKAKKALGFTPFSVVQRQVIVSQFAKAEEMRHKSWIKENIVPAASILAMVIIVSMLFIFWGDIAKPALDSHRLALQTQEQNIKILNQLGIKTGEIAQTIDGTESESIFITDTEDPPNGE
tara:strand:+ start:361 stop:1047 length:687 start_codon:yes stop_codon:yes gene_type:complete